ncbi:MAG: hypothetical protein M3Z31_09010 [Pseudomonadota bacterium]|nr:hypothetical protein [Pseudomonadota bacterium]
MGLFGSRPAPQPESTPVRASEDEQAIARYRYLLKTAPPEAIEQAHAEAFAQLSPEQRRLLLTQLAEVTPVAERPVLERGGNDPQALARMATRAEIRQPGALERLFGAGAPVAGGMPMRGGMPGFGSMMAGSLLGSVAGTVIGSTIAHEFFSHHGDGTSGVDHDSASSHLASSDDSSSLSDNAVDTDLDPGISSDFDGGSFDSGSFDV